MVASIRSAPLPRGAMPNPIGSHGRVDSQLASGGEAWETLGGFARVGLSTSLSHARKREQTAEGRRERLTPARHGPIDVKDSAWTLGTFHARINIRLTAFWIGHPPFHCPINVPTDQLLPLTVELLYLAVLFLMEKCSVALRSRRREREQRKKAKKPGSRGAATTRFKHGIPLTQKPRSGRHYTLSAVRSSDV